jgi:hypothetical protein
LEGGDSLARQQSSETTHAYRFVVVCCRQYKADSGSMDKRYWLMSTFGQGK